MAAQVVTVDQSTPELFPLVAQAYNDIFLREFPNREMEDDYVKFIHILHGGMDNVSAVINLAVDGPDAGHDSPLGMAIGYYYHDQAVGMLTYNAVAPAARSLGLGKAFVGSRIEAMQKLAGGDGRELRAAFIDVKNPKNTDAFEARMDPSLRISIFKKWGASIMPIDYFIPPNTVTGGHDDRNLLMAYGIGGRRVGPDETADFVEAFYEAELTNLGLNAADDRKLPLMMRQIAQWRQAEAAPYRAVSGLTRKYGLD